VAVIGQARALLPHDRDPLAKDTPAELGGLLATVAPTWLAGALSCREMQPALRLIIALTLVGCGSSSSPGTGPSAAVARSPAVARLPALGTPVMQSPAIGAVAASDDGATLLSAEQLLPRLRTPRQFEAATRYVRPEDLAQKIRISSDLGQHAAWLAESAELGVDDVYAFHVNLEQRAYNDAFGAKVLTQLVR
jgi:hypothetical protein